jgi:cytochrome c peroxidase
MKKQKSYIALAYTMTIVTASIGCLADEEVGAVEQSSRTLVAEVRDLIAARGIAPTPAPPPVTDELYRLGQALAFDKILSGNRNISCLTCHHPLLGTSDRRHLPLGEGGAGLGAGRSGGPIIPRNAPALFNLHTFDTMFWDSRIESDGAGGFHTPVGAAITPEMAAVLEYGVVAAQAMFPVLSRVEMRGPVGSNELADIDRRDVQGIWSAIMVRLSAIPEYVAMFEAAYPGTRFEDMTFAHAANAIAGFELRAFAALDSPWERFLAGDDAALSSQQLTGAKVFFNAGCASCHSGSSFSDFEHHNTALAQFGPGVRDGATGNDDFGRERVTGDPADRYAFRTPALVNVELTAPYGHVGQFADLETYVAHYIEPRDNLLDYDITRHVNDPALHGLELDNSADVLAGRDPLLRRISLDEREVRRVVAFLRALTAESSRDLSGVVPGAVPSGLPVAD